MISDSSSLSMDISGGAPEGPLFLVALAAQLVIVVCFAAQWFASAKAGRIVIPPLVVYGGLAASAVLLGAAVTAKDYFLVISQLLSVLVGLRLVLWMRRIAARSQKSLTRGLPVVAPDSAEWRPTNSSKPRDGVEPT